MCRPQCQGGVVRLLRQRQCPARQVHLVHFDRQIKPVRGNFRRLVTVTPYEQDLGQRQNRRG